MASAFNSLLVRTSGRSGFTRPLFFLPARAIANDGVTVAKPGRVSFFVLWLVAAICSLIAVGLGYFRTGHVNTVATVFAILFAGVAFLSSKR
jgi:hypothetical protein